MSNEERAPILLVPKRGSKDIPESYPRIEQTINPDSLPKSDFDAELKNIEGLDKITNPLDRPLPPEENLNLAPESGPLEPIPMTVEQSKPLDNPPVSPEESGLSVENNIPDTVESLDEQIKKEELLLEHDKSQKLTITAQGDEQKLKDLIARRDSLLVEQVPKEEPASKAQIHEEPTPATPESVVPVTPEVPPAAPEPAPTPIPETPAPIEIKTFAETLELQEQAFSARKDMLKFRANRKIADLNPEDLEKYKQFREVFQKKYEILKTERNKLPEEQQEDLGKLKKLQEVQERLVNMTPEQIAMDVLLISLREKKKQLRIIDLQIKDQNTDEDLKDFQKRRRGLLIQIASMEEELSGGRSLQDQINDLQGEKTGENTTEPKSETRQEIPAENIESDNEPNDDHHFERTHAESKGRTREELQSVINELSKRIDIKTQELGALPMHRAITRVGLHVEIEKLSRERAKLQAELNGEQRRMGYGERFKLTTQKAYRKIKEKIKGDGKGSTARFWGQRALGLLTFGGLDAYKANQFRKGTKSVAEQAGAYAGDIEQQQNFSSVEAAQIDAMEMGDTTGLDVSAVEKLSQEVTDRKIKDNDARINEIIISVISGLEEKLKKYKGDRGENVLTEEAKDKIAIDLQNRLNDMRYSTIGADAKAIKKMLRENLDPDWWHRYVWAGLELAGASTIVYLGGPLLASKFAAMKTGGVASKEVAQVALKDTVWAEAKRQLIAHGVTNPTSIQIQQVTTKFCADSGIQVMEGGKLLWAKTAGGKFVDTILAKGVAIKISGGLKLIAGMVP